MGDLPERLAAEATHPSVTVTCRSITHEQLALFRAQRAVVAEPASRLVLLALQPV